VLNPSASLASAAFPGLKKSNQPDDLSKSTLHTRSINLGKPDSMPAYPAGPIKKMPSG
jgi:hypothetical protein